MFGQYALVNNDLRSATIICATDCLLMVFNQESFEMIKKFFSRDFNQRRAFIQSLLPCFENFTEDTKIKTIQYFEPESFVRVKFID